MNNRYLVNINGDKIPCYKIMIIGNKVKILFDEPINGSLTRWVSLNKIEPILKVV